MKRIAANLIYWPLEVAKVACVAVFWIVSILALIAIVAGIVCKAACTIWECLGIWVPCVLWFVGLTALSLGVRWVFRWTKENRR